MGYTEADLREAFKAGWKERDRFPGLKKTPKVDGHNTMLRLVGGEKYAEHVYLKDHRTYSHSVWTGSSFFRKLKG